jgi:N-acetylglucosaminyldiphosphoundecaprenol N-acetyl-beta-D-mannosaminyltransferase
MKIELLGIKVNTESKGEIIQQLQSRIKSGQKSFIVTPYSEFFYRGFLDFDFKKILNQADFSLPDGIAVQWLGYYLGLSLKAKSFYGKVLQAFTQMVYTGADILLRPSKLKTVVPEKISGSEFFWDLCEIANQSNLSIFLLGGFGETAALVSKKILQRYPNVKIAGVSSADPTDQSLVNKINQAKTDILMVAYGPPKQERWIFQNLKDLDVKVAIGLGGTFDYISGKKIRPPQFIREVGLEWLFRLITQPHRYKRILNATFGLVRGTIRYKVFITMPFRPNVVGVIIDQQNQVFVAKRFFNSASTEHPSTEEHWQFPQGGIDLHEDPEKAVLREMREEIHTENLQILGKSSHTNTYLWNHTIRNLSFNRLKFKGQEQTIYYLKYFGDNSDIVLDHHELSDYRWVAPSELPNVIHRYRQDLIKIVMEEIGKYTNGK